MSGSSQSDNGGFDKSESESEVSSLASLPRTLPQVNQLYICTIYRRKVVCIGSNLGFSFSKGRRVVNGGSLKSVHYKNHSCKEKVGLDTAHRSRELLHN